VKVVFLDRDGVINRDSDSYVKSWEEFAFLPRSKEAVRLLTINGYRPIIITNQSAVGRKLLCESTLSTIHGKMAEALSRCGGKIEAVFHCPHLPEDGCDCRKPKPGLILQAQQTYRLDLSSTFMVGDSLKDMEAAWGAGCGHTILVRTGNGEKAERVLRERGKMPDHVARDLYGAVRWILDKTAC